MNRAGEFFAKRAQQNDTLLERADLFIKRFFALDDAVYKEGEIPAKYKEILGLVASTVLRCDDCYLSHRASEEGRGEPCRDRGDAGDCPSGRWLDYHSSSTNSVRPPRNAEELRDRKTEARDLIGVGLRR